MKSAGRAWCALLFLALSLSFSRASLKESNGFLFGSRQRNLLTSASTNASPPFPEAPAGNQVYLIAYMGGTYEDVLAIGPTSDKATALATVLDKWQHSQGQDREVNWSQEDDVAAAEVDFASDASFGRTSGETHLAFGSLAAAFRSSGYVPLGVLRVASCATTSLKEAPFQNTATLLYDLRSLRDSDSLTVSVKISPYAPFLFVLWLFFVPLVTLSSFAVASAYSKRSSIPLNERRKRFPKIALGGCYAAIAFHALSFIALNLSGQLQGITDLFFGSQVVFVIAPFMFLGVLFILPLLVVMPRIEKKLYGPSETAQPVPDRTPEEKAHVKKFAKVSLALATPFLVAYLALMFLTPPKHPEFRVLGILCLAIALFFPRVAAKKLVPGGQEFQVGREEPELTSRAADLALRIGMAAKSVYVLNSKRAYIGVYSTDRRITLSLAAVEQLTPGEMDFLLARELARKRPPLWLAMLFVAPMALLPVSVLLLHPQNARIFISVIFGFTVAAMLVLLSISPKINRQKSYDADREAVRATGDLEAAISCLLKEAERSDTPGLYAVDNRFRPSTQNRIEALRKLSV